MRKKLLLLCTLYFLCLKNYSQVTKQILLEEFSTAPCGFCPDGDLVAAQIISNHPSVIWVTHHAGFGTDSMTANGSVPIANAFTTFAPGACIDRGDYPIPVYTTPPYIAISRQKWDSVCVAHLNDPPVVDVTIVPQYNATSRILDCAVNTNFLIVPVSGDLRVNLFLVEDSVVGFGSGYDQTNYYNTTLGHPFYNAGNPIVGYIHHHVVRYIASAAWGQAGVIPNTPVMGATYSYSFNNISIPVSWKENDIEIVAFVSYYNTDAHLRQVLNSGKIKMTGTTNSIEGEPGAFSVFPNPASEYINFFSDNPVVTDTKFILKDIAGKTVMEHVLEKGKVSLTVSASDLSTGIYFYTVASSSEIISNGKLVVSK